MSKIYVLAHNIRSLYNVGALFRLCDGVDVTKLYLTGITGAPFDDVKHQRQRRQIAKTALTGLESVDWEYRADPFEIIAELKAAEVEILALEQADNSTIYTKASFKSSVCLVLGHETDGVDQTLLNQADQVIEIPMFGQGKSLNVISATSVILYHIKLANT